MRQAGSRNPLFHRAKIATFCVPILVIATLSQPALAAPGDLDHTFDNDGIVITPFGSYNAGANSIAIQPNGKIFVAGQRESASADAFGLARYDDVAGALDWKVTTSIGPSYDGAQAVALQSKRWIVAAGFAAIGNHTEFALARYNKLNGALDCSFGPAPPPCGKVTTPVGSNASASSIAIQSDGKIVVAGQALIGGSDDFAVVRYKKNGILDCSFGPTPPPCGKVTTPFGQFDARAHSVAIQSDGKIVVVGDAFNGSYEKFALARFKANGLLDNVFPSGGKTTTAFGPRDASAASVAIQSNGKIVAAGRALSPSNNSLFALARYKSNLTLDMKVTTSINSDAAATSVAIQPDGKIVAAGQAFNGANNEFALARYLTNLTLDTTFGSSANGKVTTPIGSDANARAVAIQSDGKIVAAGQASNGNNYDFALTRYDG